MHFRFRKVPEVSYLRLSITLAYDFLLGDQPYRSPLKNYVSEYNNESIYFHEHASYFLFFQDRPEKPIRKVTGEGIGKIFNLSIPESDKYPISPYIITAESHIKVMRVKEMLAI